MIVSGEAGIGKSSLLDVTRGDDARGAVAFAGPTRRPWCGVVPPAASPYEPIIELPDDAGRPKRVSDGDAPAPARTPAGRTRSPGARAALVGLLRADLAAPRRRRSPRSGAPGCTRPSPRCSARSVDAIHSCSPPKTSTGPTTRRSSSSRTSPRSGTHPRAAGYCRPAPTARRSTAFAAKPWNRRGSGSTGSARRRCSRSSARWERVAAGHCPRRSAPRRRQPVLRGRDGAGGRPRRRDDRPTSSHPRSRGRSRRASIDF